MTHFTAVSDLSSYVSISFTTTRSDRATGTVSYDITLKNISTYSIFAPVILILNPAQGFTGVPLNATAGSGGSWLISLNSTIPGGVELKPGQTTTGQTLTISDPNQLTIAYTSSVSGTPATASAPVFDTTPVTAVAAGKTYTYQARAHDPDGSTPGFLLTNAPGGMTVDPKTGLITWKTSSTTPASVLVDLDAYDPSGSFSQQQFFIQVGGGVAAPVITPLPAQVVGVEGKPIVLTVAATDPGGRALVYWADNLPNGASFDPATHSLLWQPGHGQAGTYNDVTFYVSNGVGVVSTSLTLLVSASPPPPQLATISDQTVREGDHLRFTLQGSVSDGSTLTYSSASLPENATLNPITGVFDWAVGYDQAGTVTVPFTVTTKAGLSTAETVVYTILPAPAAPAFGVLQSQQIDEGQPLSITAFAVDPHNPTFVLPTRLPDGTLSSYPTTNPTVTYSVSSLPAGASFDPDTALFTWTPGNNQGGRTTSPSRPPMTAMAARCPPA